MFNQGGVKLDKLDVLPSKSENSLMLVKSILSELKNSDVVIDNRALALSNFKSEINYDLAFNEISGMLSGNIKQNLKRAVFLVESSYYDATNGLQDYLNFDNAIKEMANVIRVSNAAKKSSNLHLLVLKYLTDTMSYTDNTSEGGVKVSYPKKYDFSDPFGDDDISKLFVSKLINENAGQCKSLPLLYLLLIEELGGEAYLSFSPEHSYIKCKKNNGGFYNIELTNGSVTSDAWIVASGYVKSEAIRNGIYMDTINQKQVIANCLVDLAKNYSRRFGETNFVLKCADKSLEYFPNNIHGLMLKSNYYTKLFRYLNQKCQAENEDELKQCPETYQQFLMMHKMYALVDGVGYEPIPEDVYQTWLKEMEEEAKKVKGN